MGKHRKRQQGWAGVESMSGVGGAKVELQPGRQNDGFCEGTKNVKMHPISIDMYSIK